MEKGTLYFFTGLAGAGKTTIGGLFYERLKERKPDAVKWDGDGVRKEHTNRDYSTQGRLIGARHMFARAKELTDTGVDLVFCSICMYDEVRDWARANIENYKEIYIKASMKTLYSRNQKGLYSPGVKQVVGVDLPWDEPKHSDIVIENDGQETPEEIVERIARVLLGEEKKGMGECTNS